MKRFKLLVALVGGATMLFVGTLVGAATMQTRADYTAALNHASAEHKQAQARCEPLGGHERNMCVVEAKAVEKRAKATAEANFRGTVKAKTDSRIANADADYMVAKVACDIKTDTERDICVKEAHATQIKQVADAKANKTAVDARADAREEARDAQYKGTLAKCDAMSATDMSATDRTACMNSAKSAYKK